MLHAVIMAGGSGTRFWPESRADRPKQLLSLFGRRSMIQGTLARLEGLAPPERTLIAGSARLSQAIADQLPGVPAQNIIAEPCKRDTAPCIGLAAFACLRDDPDAVMAVMPSDHVIQDSARFQQALQLAADGVVAAPSRIVTFGIKPTYAAEGFGYIERGESLTYESSHSDLAPVYRVRRFREKPNAATAAEYLASGDFYWNSGIFVWRADTILNALRQRQPETYDHLAAIEAAFGKPEWPDVFAERFAAIKPISVDYAVMEQAEDVAVVEAPFDWDDVGSWEAFARLQGQNDSAGCIDAKHLGIDVQDLVVRSADQGHLIVTLGLKDVLVVHTPDATLVADRSREESIRQVVKQLEERGWKEHL